LKEGEVVMKKLLIPMALGLALLVPAALFAFPTVYPHGTTIYMPDKCFNGYTILPTKGEATVVIDMNGNVVKQWKKVGVEEHPSKLLPGGYVMGATGARGRIMDHEDSNDLSVVDWDGNIIWSYPKAGMHHDFQREGNPVGYYVPGMEPHVKKGKTLILSHKIAKNKRISNKKLYDDVIFEVDYEGNVIFEWLASDHFKEMGFTDPLARAIMYKYPNYVMTRTPGVVGGDWIHINSASWVGPNKWYDAGDERFHPDNIIYDGRQTDTTGIIDRKTGKIVWHLGPDFTASKALRKMGETIGLHHAHIIPKGLPGEGNLLIFDNGGYGGYGAPNPGAPTGLNYALRDHSRVLEIDPITLKVVWQYTANKAGYRDKCRFYSDYVSSAQRLPNGNTLITEGSFGRLFEVTPDFETVWEYVSPFYNRDENFNLVYRAYRAPYDYIPQLKKPKEKAVIPPENSTLRLGDLKPAK
jgi:hypothetical protein